jgi:hypothetical protein
MHHWTDQKIKVHAFYCVLALQIAHLMRRHAHQAGLRLSVRELIAPLAGIEETVLLYPSTGGRPKARRMLTETDPTQQRLYALFDLDRYAPRPPSPPRCRMPPRSPTPPEAPTDDLLQSWRARR